MGSGWLLGLAGANQGEGIVSESLSSALILISHPYESTRDLNIGISPRHIVTFPDMDFPTMLTGAKGLCA